MTTRRVFCSSTPVLGEARCGRWCRVLRIYVLMRRVVACRELPWTTLMESVGGMEGQGVSVWRTRLEIGLKPTR